MSLFKNLLFLHGHFTDPHMDDGEAPAAEGHYGQGYGNRQATANALRQPWHSASAALAAASGDAEGTNHVCNDAG